MINEISFPALNLSFTINRAAFSIFGLNIYWYGIIIMTGILLAVLYAWFECEKHNCGVKMDDVLNMLLFSIPISIICARIYYVAFSFDSYKDNIIEIFNIRNGGIAIYGAVLGAVLTVFVYCRIKKISTLKVLDILAVGLLIGQCIGRYGNFVNGEAFGSQTDNILRMTIIRDGVLIADSVHPTFFYESLWNAVGIVILLVLKRFKRVDGELICEYIAWYGMGRFWIEGLRTDSLMLGGFRVSQLVALASVIIGITGFIFLRHKCESKSYHQDV